MSPPTPDPEPTKKLKAPARPWVAVPVERERYPLFPATEAPVEKASRPETPAEVMLADDTVIDPVAPLTLSPLLIRTEPPTAGDRDAPADNTMSPADPELLVPTSTLTLPLRPLVANPLRSKSQPELPDADDPVTS